jgi:hypothetical protein
MKIDDIPSYTQELIGGGEFMVTLIKLRPLKCLMLTGMEQCGECNNVKGTEGVNNTIFSPCFILNVEMELL